MARDVTSIKRREREWAAVASLSAALRTATLQSEVLPLIAQQISSWLEVEAVALGLIDTFTSEIVLRAAYGPWSTFLGTPFHWRKGWQQKSCKPMALF